MLLFLPGSLSVLPDLCSAKEEGPKRSSLTIPDWKRRQKGACFPHAGGGEGPLILDSGGKLSVSQVQCQRWLLMQDIHISLADPSLATFFGRYVELPFESTMPVVPIK